MATAGIIITQPGVDVKTAADYQMIFNSNWPSLQIAFEGIITVAGYSSGQIAHGLGFFPLTMAWFLVNNVSVGRFYGVTTFDINNVYINNSSNAGSVTVSIKCYNIDISKNVDYTLPLPPTYKAPYDSTYGIKVVKNGKNITSTDLRDFILHSRAQSPAVLSVVTETKGIITGNYVTIQYTNPATYTPWVLGFITPFGNKNLYQCYAPGGNQAAPAFFQIGTKSVIWTNGTGGAGTIVVLRDPLVISTKVQVIYNG